MGRKVIAIFVFGLCPVLPLLAGDTALRAAIRERSEGALLDESTAAEQAAVQARSGSEFSLELRPSLSDDTAGVALRLYLPERWSKNALREQLALAAESEQLRVAALEWQELLAVYRDFCTYRMARRQSNLYAAELAVLEPVLAQADLGVKQNQLSVTDRARLYSQYLDLLNDREKVEMELIGIRRRLHLALGGRADLDVLAESAAVAMPLRSELDVLIRQALENRADYRRLDVDARALAAAETAARSADRFRLKYIQPEYNVDYDDGGQSVGLSAAFVLPWGTRSPAATVYQRQRALAVSAMDQQHRMMSERLEVLLSVADALKEQNDRRSRLVLPLINQLKADLAAMDHLMIEQLRDRFSIRERILSAALQSARADCEREMLAVDLAEEIGAFSEQA